MKAYCDMNSPILLLDNDGERLHTLANILSPLKNNIHIATTRQHAQSLIDAGLEPAVVIIDSFTHGDGCTLIKVFSSELQKRPFYSDILCVIPQTQPQLIDHALASGATDIITRPFNHNLVQARVRALCRTGQPAHSHADTPLSSHDETKIHNKQSKLFGDEAAYFFPTATALCVDIATQNARHNTDIREEARRRKRVEETLANYLHQHHLVLTTRFDTMLIAITQNDAQTPQSTQNAAEAALFIMNQVPHLKSLAEHKLMVRIGLDIGPLVVETKHSTSPAPFIYGSAFSTAKYLAETGRADSIQISQHLKTRLENAYQCEDRGLFYSTTTGMIMTYFLSGRRFE